MKSGRFCKIAAALLVGAVMLYGQTLPVQLGSYALRISVAASKEGGRIPLAVVPATKSAGVFGFFLPVDNEPILQVLEAGAMKPVLSVTAADFLAKAKLVKSGKRVTANYTIGKGPGARQVEVEAVGSADEGMPFGEKTVLNYRVKLEKGNYVARVRLLTNGTAQLVGTTAIASSKMDKGKSTVPVLLLASSGAVRWSVSPMQGGEYSLCVAEAVPTEAAGGWLTLFSFDVSGTTISEPAKAMEQVQHIANRVSAKEESPDLIITNEADRNTTVPGDTVTYTISYQNIGSGYAQDAVISNPVPEGTSLIEQSPAGKNATVTIDRKPGVGGVPGDPSVVKWKINGRILPGESGVVTMKVIVR